MKRSHNKTRFTGTWTRTRESILDKYCQTEWSWIPTAQLLNNNTYYSLRLSHQQRVALSKEHLQVRERAGSNSFPLLAPNQAQSSGTEDLVSVDITVCWDNSQTCPQSHFLETSVVGWRQSSRGWQTIRVRTKTIPKQSKVKGTPNTMATPLMRQGRLINWRREMISSYLVTFKWN